MPKSNKKSARFDRCVEQVKAKGGAYSPYAVCQTSVGKPKTGGKKKK